MSEHDQDDTASAVADASLATWLTDVAAFQELELARASVRPDFDDVMARHERLVRAAEPDEGASDGVEELRGEMADWVDDVCAWTEREVDARRPRPDFAEVVARAHVEAPARVGADKLAEARALAAVIPLTARARDEALALDDELEGFLEDVRDVVDAEISERRMSAIPPVPGVDAPRRWGRTLWSVAAAAVLLLGVGIGTGALSIDNLKGSAAQQRFQAPLLQRGEDGAAGQAAVHVEPPRGATTQQARAQEDADRGSEDEVEEGSEAGAVDGFEDGFEDGEDGEDGVDGDRSGLGVEDADASARRRVTRPTGETAPAKPTLDEQLKALDEEAQALWRQGDRAGAEQRFRELIRRGGRRARVQLAYGDLFALVRQDRGGAAEEAVWREYLERFPRGRHADDARAGLCRRAPAADQDACWRRYLDDFPRGAHRSQATRALASAPKNEP